jgi:hypothetical protein
VSLADRQPAQPASPCPTAWTDACSRNAFGFKVNWLEVEDDLFDGSGEA